MVRTSGDGAGGAGCRAAGAVQFPSAARGKGSRVRQHNGAKKGAPAPASFPYTYDRRERTVFFTALVNNGDNDNFFGVVVTPWPMQEPVTVENLDPNGGSADRVFVSRSRSTVPGSKFDDIVAWIPMPVLVSRMVGAGQLP